MTTFDYAFGFSTTFRMQMVLKTLQSLCGKTKRWGVSRVTGTVKFNFNTLRLHRPPVSAMYGCPVCTRWPRTSLGLFRQFGKRQTRVARLRANGLRCKLTNEFNELHQLRTPRPTDYDTKPSRARTTFELRSSNILVIFAYPDGET